MLKMWMIVLLLLACLSPVTVAAVETAAVRNTLSFPQKSNQYVHVQSRIPAVASETELILPSWTPGSYLIRDFAGNLERLQASSSDGAPLAITKIAKNRWRIDSSGISEITLDYDVWAGRKHVSESWVESSFAILNGAGLFLYNDQTRKLPHYLELELPPSWATVHTPLEKAGGERLFRAADYDELVDSPVAVGNMLGYDFEVEGHPYELVLATANTLWDDAQSVGDVARIVEAQQDFWEVNPFDRKYSFINMFTDKFGGLEHDHSTVMMCSPWQMRGSKDYIKWLGLVSHEFFHSWNVRRMRPESLAEYDYEQEMYTRELWLAEGLTSYYDDLLLFRGGLIDVRDYLDLLAEGIRNYETRPGREVRSAEMASFDTWIKQYKPDENKLNSTISYYRKGAVISFVADMEIRRQTKNEASLDSVMREMYRRHGQGGAGQAGYPPGAFEDLVEEAAGPEVRAVVENMLQTTDDPDVDKALDWYGLKLLRAPDLNADDEPTAGLGVKWEVVGASLLAGHVLLGQPAADAGVLPGDELLAIDGLRVRPDDIQAQLLKLRPDEQIEMTLVRHERLLTLPVTVGTSIPASYAITSKPGINGREKKRLEAWLGRDLKFN
jgi:predicted metalloprotease with PDZ domain